MIKRCFFALALSSMLTAQVSDIYQETVGVFGFGKKGCDTPIIEEDEEECISEVCFDLDRWCDPEKRWYFEIEPGYFFFTDSDMRKFFDHGGFTIRAETGYKFYGPLIVWVDASYFHKTGSAIGGSEKLKITIATITLGLKGIYYFNPYVAVYGGLGPRLFLMMMRNNSPFVRGVDNEIGIGGGFDAGIWVFPVPQWPNFFLDAFADYSLKTMKIEEDEISSLDNDVNISGLSIGLGLGVRF